MTNKNITLAITMGDPAGIGPEIILKSLVRRVFRRTSFLVIGDSSVLNKTARQLGLKIKNFTLVDLKNVDKDIFKFGKTNANCGKAAIEYIKTQVDLVRPVLDNASVIARISQKAVNLAGFNWPGHTELLASLTRTKKFCMVLAAGPLKVVLATRHIALKDVSKRLNAREIYDAIILINEALNAGFGIKNPRIAVCALNPHAGENGLFSDEEKLIITPAIKKARATGINVIGPMPADSLFYDAYRNKFDAEIVMYHDQGLIPLKMIGKDKGVNITLGLPFVRTSPAHGTAFDIAGRNKANPSSMIEAIKMAIKICKN